MYGTVLSVGFYQGSMNVLRTGNVAIFFKLPNTETQKKNAKSGSFRI